ncbi:MAG: hypothetical protein AAF182_03040, partial [Pseudomonadota bacterium]
MPFKSIDGKLLKSRIKAENVQNLYQSLFPIRRMIQDRGIVNLEPSPLFISLVSIKRIQEAFAKANPDKKPMKDFEASKISEVAKKHREMAWPDVQRIDRLSEKLYNAFTDASKQEIIKQRLEEKPNLKLPQSRYGTDHPDDDEIKLAPDQ